MKRSPLISTAIVITALSGLPALAGDKPTTAREEKSFHTMVHCQVLAALLLDDGISAADAISIAAIEQCQNEASYWLRDTNVKVSQEEVNDMLVNMRNALIGVVLRNRAKQRLRSITHLTVRN